jgi:hypothetical protein
LFSLAVGCLLLVAGCSGGLYAPGAEQDTSPTVVLNNTANTTHSFTVWTVEGRVGQDGLQVVPRDREPYNFTPTGQIWSSHYPEGTIYVEAIQPPPDRSRLVANVSLQGNSTHRQQVEHFSHGDTLIVTAAKDNRISELVVVNCGRHPFTGLEVTVRSDTVASSSYGCR